MRALSKETSTLLARLPADTRRGLWARISGRTSDPLPIIEHVGQAREPATIPYLAIFALHPNLEVARAVADTVHALIQLIPPHEFPWLDEKMRALWAYSDLGEAWQRMKPRALGRLTRFGAASASLLGLASSHWSGYVREAAVKALAEVSSGSELPFLLVRLNDWVVEVRRAATTAIESRLRTEYAEHFLRNIVLVSRLERCERTDDTLLLGKVAKLLGSEGAQALVREGMESSDKDVRRMSFRIAADSPHECLPEVIDVGLISSDPVVRLWAARTCIERIGGEELRVRLATMRQDRFMPIRREALYAYVKKLPSEATSELRGALLDVHASIRDVARYYLKQQGERDFAATYRDGLSSVETSTVMAAIDGLGETGLGTDAESLKPFCSHAVARIRRATVRAVGRLGLDEHIELVLSALQDTSPKVSRAAQSLLQPHIHKVGQERLASIFSASRQSHVRRHALALLASIQQWSVFPLLVGACRDADPAVAAVALNCVHTWAALPYVPAGSDAEVDGASKAMSEAGDLLPTEVLQRLQFAAKSAPRR
jgi:HEAT repeat protein